MQREQRTALGVTIALSLSSLGLLTGGGIWLRKRKQDGVAVRDVNVRLSRDGLIGTARLSF